MKLIPAAVLLALCAGPALSSAFPAYTVQSCQEGAARLRSWPVNGADWNACHLTVLGAGLEPLDGEPLDKLAAFAGGALVGLRSQSLPDGQGDTIATYQPHDWTESGSIGPRGELWWGRAGNRHVAVGQQSTVRLQGKSTLIAASLRAEYMDFLMRRMMSVTQKTPMARKAGDERFMVFQRKQISYAQHAATHATFTGGLGGDGQILPGAVSNARLELDSDPAIVGQLSFDVMVDGVRRHIAFQLASRDPMRPLRAIPLGTRDYVLCEKRPNRGKLASAHCDLNTQANFKEGYDATGVFYGDHARLIALHVRLELNSEVRNRHGALATLLIILKAKE